VSAKAGNAAIDGVATARMAVYRFALQSLDKPSAEQHAWMTDDAYGHTLGALCDRFDVPGPSESRIEPQLPDHEATYIAWFEAGLPTPRVVLQASHYNQREPAPRILHEHVLFYQRFGAALRKDNLDQPDHLLNQLAFLIHLDELASHAPQDAQSIAAARRDFLHRQVIALVTSAAAAASKHGAPPVYQAVFAILATAVRQDLTLTEETLAPAGAATRRLQSNPRR